MDLVEVMGSPDVSCNLDIIRSDLPDNSFITLIFGRIAPIDGFNHLLRQWQRNNDIKLTTVEQHLVRRRNIYI